MNRGEVWWVETPTKPRPYLIVTRQSAVVVLNRVIAVPATRTTRGIETEVPLSREDGMPRDCVLSLDNIESVRKTRFIDRVCELSPAKLEEVCAALNRAVDCS